MASTGCSSCAPGCCPARRSPSGSGGLSPSWPGPRCARPRAHAPGTQRPAPLRVRRARAHHSPRLRAARDTHRARLFPWQARDGRDRKRRGCGAGGPGLHARARVKPAGASAETWRRARPPPQPSRPPPPPFSLPAVAAATAIVAALAIAPAACPRAAIDARAAVASLAPAGARPVSAPPQPPQPSYSNALPPPQPSPPLLLPPRQRESSPPSPTLPSVGACRRASWAPFRPRTENLGTFWESSHICDEV